MTTKSNSELKRLEDAARAGWLYYVGKNTQEEIAQKLKVSRQSAQRLVTLAVTEGLVKVRLDHPIAKCMDLAQALTERFGLVDCEIVPSDPASPSAITGLAQRGATIVERYLNSGMPTTLAFGTGRALKSIADEMPAMNCPQHKLVSLVGNMMSDGAASQYDIVVGMANRTQARHYPMPLPVVAESTAEKDTLHNLHAVQSILALAEQADACFVGVGHMGEQPPLLVDGFICQAELDELKQAGAAGEIISWVYDQNGRLLPNTINSRVASAPIIAAPNKPVYGVAAGEDKVSAMDCALRGRLINALITNEYTAEQILKRTP
ncbi:sugar-binding transcriptional regulator [Neiella marina]|uniref:Sugar-binding transcriptional regulator n=1 Tax=Neiella holothuriorum TaxID=2870530 RepID=A0ABS7EE55_9GAMM|nr:sugar-binding transcriptional regulator [Neiella holothuriorum]MBW8190600.1 sugar-binding transcriptional regulator [Neiella holothuriorum]